MCRGAEPEPRGEEGRPHPAPRFLRAEAALLIRGSPGPKSGKGYLEVRSPANCPAVGAAGGRQGAAGGGRGPGGGRCLALCPHPGLRIR